MPQGILKFLATTTVHEVKASQQFFWAGSTTLKQMRPLSYSHTTRTWKLHRLHKWKRRRIFEQQDECSSHGDLGCTAPPSSLSWSGPVSVPLQHKIEECHFNANQAMHHLHLLEAGKMLISLLSNFEMLLPSEISEKFDDVLKSSSELHNRWRQYQLHFWTTGISLQVKTVILRLYKPWHKTSSVSFNGRFTELLLPLP
jgi:hypothetical protein